MTFINKYSTLIIFILIFLSAAAFRITNLSLIEFKTDEAMAMVLATRPFFGHPLVSTALGSSVGILNPPLFIYLLTPLVAISKDPTFVSGIIGLINAIAIGTFFLILKKYYGLTTALIASLLLAFSPWDIIYSRKIWQQDFIIPLFIPFFYSAHKIIIDKKSSFWWMYTFFALLLLQIHQAIIFFMVPLTFFILLNKPAWSWKYFFLGIFLGIIPTIPYFVYQSKINFLDINLMFHVTDKFHLRSKKLFILPFQIMNTGYFSFIFGKDLTLFNKTYPQLTLAQNIFYLEYPAVVFGGILFWFKNKLLRPFFFATALLPLIYFILRIDPSMHYFIIIIPLLFLFVSLGLSFLINNKNFLIKTSGILIASCLILVAVWYDISFFQFLNKYDNLSGDYGMVYEKNAKQVTSLLQKFKNDPKYEEMFLFNFIEPDWMQGSYPVPRMLFSDEETKKQLNKLETRLKKTPVDASAMDELVEYYTFNTPTAADIQYLYKKKQKIPALEAVYHLADDMYLRDNLKKGESSAILHITFEYPQHWAISEDTKQNILTLNGDGFNMIIGPKPGKQNGAITNSVVVTSTSSLTIMRTDYTDNNLWFGSIYEVHLNGINTLFINLFPDEDKQFLYADAQDRIFPTTDTLLLSVTSYFP